MKNVWNREYPTVLLQKWNCDGNVETFSLSYLAESCRLCAAMFRLYRRKAVQSVVSCSGGLLFEGAG